MDKEPLVSVCVITYNSSDYIVDTLESVKKQTYKNFELVISDDCSTDDTFAICQDWVDRNAERFVQTKLVSTPHNIGVAGNCNNAYSAAEGIWIKVLSGDDRLLEYAITEYVNYVNEHPECRICFAKLHFWGEDNEYVSKNKSFYETFFYPYIRKGWKVQYKENLKRLFVPGPGLFVQKSLWQEIEGFDERYPFAEEHPFTYNVLAAGHRIYFLDKELYGYQIRAGSLCRENNRKNERVFNDEYRYFKECRRWNMIRKGLILSAYHQSISFYYQSLCYKSANKVILFLGKVMILTSPLFYWHRWKRLLS